MEQSRLGALAQRIGRLVNPRAVALPVALAPVAALELLGMAALVNFALSSDTNSLYIGIGISVLSGLLAVWRVLEWQRKQNGGNS